MKAQLIVAIAALGAVLLVGKLVDSERVHAQSSNDDEWKVQAGLAIAPVPLNLEGKSRAMVGLGSYLVNAAGDCNGCHTSGPSGEYMASGNHYLLAPVYRGKKLVNTHTYLGGGFDFGPLAAGSYDVVSRNLTPDKTGLPAGGMRFADFVQVMKTGVDMDHLHPTCPRGSINGRCVPYPVNGAVLQIMPWPAFQNMSDRDLRAIYEYLSAVPCVAGPPAPSPVHNDCQ